MLKGTTPSWYGNIIHYVTQKVSAREWGIAVLDMKWGPLPLLNSIGSLQMFDLFLN